MMKAPRRGLRLAKFQLLLLLLLGFLLPDVVADRLLGQTDGADAVPTRPEVVAREVPLPTQILPVNSNRRLPFQEAHRVRHTEFRRHAQQHVHVICKRVAFHQPHTVPLAQERMVSPCIIRRPARPKAKT